MENQFNERDIPKLVIRYLPDVRLGFCPECEMCLPITYNYCHQCGQRVSFPKEEVNHGSV